MTNGASGTSGLSGRERWWGVEEPPTPIRKDPCDVFGKEHDFDACPTFVVQDSKLFAKGSSDAHDIEATDVQQRMTGDCYFDAPMAALAQTDAGRAHLKSLVTEWRGEQGDVEKYFVTLKERDTDFLNKIGARETFHDRDIEVQPRFPKGTNEAKDGKVWAPVFEKAWAQMNGGYNNTVHGGQARDAFNALGLKVDTHAPGFRYGAKEILADVRAGKLMTMGTVAKPGAGLVGEHEYTVEGAYEKNGEVYVKLRNPWGYDHPPDVSVADVKKYIDVIDAATLP
jgi:hypothetical protein